MDEFDIFDEFGSAIPHGNNACGDNPAIPDEDSIQEHEDRQTASSGQAKTDDREADGLLDELDESMKKLATRLAPLLSKLALPAGRAVAGDEDFYEEDEATQVDGEDAGNEGASQPLAGLKPEDEALADQLAAEAAETEDDQEAEYLAAGVVVQIFSPAPVVIKRVVPALVHRTIPLVRFLRRRPRVRALLRVLPAIEAQTMASLVRAADQGLPITRRAAIRTLRGQTVRLFRSPRRVVTALRRNSARRRWLNRRAIARAERSV